MSMESYFKNSGVKELSIGNRNAFLPDDDVPPDWAVGDVILGMYEVEKIHEGGMGLVYRVRHRGWNMHLAVKSPRREYSDSREDRENFVREAETWVGLGMHPHVVTCFYVRTLGGIPRIFAEYVGGGSLMEWIRSGRLYAGDPKESLARIIDVAVQMAWGLRYAHENGLVHQDVKPANILLTEDGTARVTDFGLARARAATGERGPASPQQSILVSWAGLTPAYCSPEQADHGKLSRRTDVWSWAVSLLEMFTGSVTWSLGPLADAALEEYIREGPSKGHLPKMPDSVSDLLRRCLQPRPENRPKDMREVAAVLQEIYGDVTSRPFPRPDPQVAEAVADSLNNQAASLLDLGRPREAEMLLDKALASDAKHSCAAYNRALLLWRSGRGTDEDMLLALREILSKSTAGREEKQMLGWTHVERGDIESARTAFAEAGCEEVRGQAIRDDMDKTLAELPGGCQCLWSLRGHDGAIRDVTFTPDGRLAITASDDKTLIAWDLRNGRCLWRFEGHRLPVNHVATGSRGRIAISTSHDGTLRIWDLQTGQSLKTLEGHDTQVRSLAITPDERLSVSSCLDGTLHVWDLSEGRCLRVLDGHDGPVEKVVVTPDGRMAVSAGRGPALLVWDLQQGRCVWRFEGHSPGITCLSLTADGRMAVSAGYDRTLRLWDLREGRQLHILRGHEHIVRKLALSPNCTQALSGSDDNTLRVWDLKSGSCLQTLKGHRGTVSSIVFMPDSRRAISGGSDRNLRVWDLSTGQCVRTMDNHTLDIMRLTYIPSWRLSVLSRNSDEFNIWDIRAARLYSRAPLMVALPRTYEKTAANRKRFDEFLITVREGIATGDWKKATQAFRLARCIPGYERCPEILAVEGEVAARSKRGRFLASIEEYCFDEKAGHVTDIALTPDSRLAITAEWENSLHVWDVSEKRCRGILEGHDRVVYSVALSADGSKAVSGSADGTLRVWDVESLKTMRLLKSHNGVVCSVTVSPDGKRVVSVGDDKIIRLWDVETGMLLRTIHGQSGVLSKVAVTPDGKLAVTAGYSGDIQVWDLREGRNLSTLERHRGIANSVAITPDGKLAVSGSNDCNCRSWDLLSGRCLHVLEGHSGHVLRVAVTPDGEMAVSSSNDRTLRIWDLSTGLCLQVLEGYALQVEAIALTPDGRSVLSAGVDGILRMWHLDWDRIPCEPADWDEGARSSLETFLSCHTPFAGSLPPDKLPTDEEAYLALIRSGRPVWSEKEFQELLQWLGFLGYGWLRPEGVLRELQKMAQTWRECPPLPPEEESRDNTRDVKGPDE